MSNRYAERKALEFSVPDSKVCSTCKAEKAGTEFKRHPLNLDGFMGECAECYRNRILIRKFGITAADYDKMKNEQDGVCKICKRECPTGRALAVDHDHETGRVRGLLCSKCNRGIGMFDDSRPLMLAAYNYLGENY